MESLVLAEAMSRVEGYVDSGLSDERCSCVVIYAREPRYGYDQYLPLPYEYAGVGLRTVEEAKRSIEEHHSRAAQYSYFYTVDFSKSVKDQYNEIENLLKEKYN